MFVHRCPTASRPQGLAPRGGRVLPAHSSLIAFDRSTHVTRSGPKHAALNYCRLHNHAVFCSVHSHLWLAPRLLAPARRLHRILHRRYAYLSFFCYSGAVFESSRGYFSSDTHPRRNGQSHIVMRVRSTARTYPRGGSVGEQFAVVPAGDIRRDGSVRPAVFDTDTRFPIDHVEMTWSTPHAWDDHRPCGERRCVHMSLPVDEGTAGTAECPGNQLFCTRLITWLDCGATGVMEFD